MSLYVFTNKMGCFVQKFKNHHYIYLLNYRVRMRDLKKTHKICKGSKDFSIYSNTN